MKTLYIIRHGKSSWDDPSLDDFDRPLNKRGNLNAPMMGKRLKARKIHPDHILSSSATRAKATAEHIGIALRFPVEKITYSPTLYHAESAQILQIIKQIDNQHNVLFVVGHNPGLTDFSNRIRNDRNTILNIPTCGIVAFRFDVHYWNEVSWGTGQLLNFDYPKNES
jgi:phosphohistidine phosphatase